MDREQKATARGELIGLRCRVVASTDPRKSGVHGVVVDETMHTLTLDTGSGVVMVAKPECSFRFEHEAKGAKAIEVEGERLSRDERSPAGFREVRGADIDFRPEDRIKKVR